MPGTTPSQTVGPYYSIGLPWPDGPYVVEPSTEGAITLRGQVFDGAGGVIPDALIETWQAGPDGTFGEGFRGFGRSPTRADGSWEIVTLKPGRVDGQAPHVDVSLFARGLLNRVVTRIYFPDEDNAADPVLSALSEGQRAALVAEAVDERSGDERSARGRSYRFDIHLQGPRETTFFAV